MKWPWSRGKHEHPHDPEAEAAARRAEELERRAEVAGESLTEFLRRRDPWAGPVLKTIHGGRHGR